MNNRAVTLSLVMAVLAIFFVQSYVKSIEQEARDRYGTQMLVLKAKRDIKEEESLNEAMLQFDLVPKNFLEPSAIYFEKRKEDDETSKSLKSLTGAVALVPIKKGEQITYNKIVEPSLRTGLAPQVTPGKRAVSIRVDEVSGVSKLVKPGDRVDLIAIVQYGNNRQDKMAKTLMQDVVVLAVGRNVTNNVARVVEIDAYTGKDKVRSLSEDASFSSVTVEVEPSQAQTLALAAASNENSIILSLRNNDDTDRLGLDGVTVQDLLGDDNRVRRPAGR